MIEAILKPRFLVRGYRLLVLLGYFTPGDRQKKVQ